MYIFIFFSFPSSFLPTRCGKSSFINAPACAASFASHPICVMPCRGTFVLQTVCRTIATPEKAQELSSKWETCFSLALWGGGGRGEIENKSPYPNALTSIVRSMQRPFLANATTCCFVICKPVIYWRGVHLEANFSIYKILSFFSSFLSTFCHSAIAIVLRPRLQPPTKVPLSLHSSCDLPPYFPTITTFFLLPLVACCNATNRARSHTFGKSCLPKNGVHRKLARILVQMVLEYAGVLHHSVEFLPRHCL